MKENKGVTDMKVIYMDILEELANSIEKAKMHGRTIKYIELKRWEWSEFLGDYRELFANGPCEYLGVTIQPEEE